jgi:hypothetical protein
LISPLYIFLCFLFLIIGTLLFNSFKYKGLATFSCLVFAVLFLSSYFDESSDFAKENSHAKLILSLCIIYFVPVTLLATIAKLCEKVSYLKSSVIAVISSIIVGASWPVFVLLTICSIGLECI